MIAVIIPAHNEARRLGRCLKSVNAAAALAREAGHQVEVPVVLDRCTDSSAAIARRHQVETMSVSAGTDSLDRQALRSHQQPP